MTKRVLVPLDGSKEAESILSQVQRIAGPGDEVHLLHLVPPLHAPVGLEATHELPLHEKGATYLELTRKLWLPRREGLDVVRTGDPAEGILALALEKNTDLIAMTTQGRSGIARLFLGSVALTVVRKAQLPVLLTRPDMAISSGPIRRILVSLEGGEASKDLLATVKALAAGPKAEIILFHATPGVKDPAPQASPFTPWSRLTSPERRLQLLADVLEEEGYTAWPVVTEGEAAPEILSNIKKHAVDLVALATHARSGLERLLEGSVAEQVLRQSPVAVLLQKPLVVHQPILQGESHG